MSDRILRYNSGVGNVELPPPQARSPSPAADFIAGFVGGFIAAVILFPFLALLLIILVDKFR
jgi:hypothetical protein